MPKFEVNIILEAKGRTAQELADDVIKVLRGFTLIDSIEVKMVGVTIRRREEYFRR